MSAKFTPGPWQTHVGHDATGYPCFFIHGMSGDAKRDVTTLEANARLIAAAPDMRRLIERVASGHLGSTELREAIAMLARIDGDERLAMR